MSYEQLKLENQICFPLYAASRLVIRAYQTDLDKLGITYPQYLVLMLLWEHGEMTVNGIAEKLILNTNTVTPLLKRMEVDGVVIRRQSETDQRKVMVQLSEKGMSMQEQAAEIPFNLMSRLNITMNETDLKAAMSLKETLTSLIETLEKVSQNAE